MRKKVIWVIVSCLIVAILVIVLSGRIPGIAPVSWGAGKSPENAIIGTWQEINVAGGETIRFFADGTMSTTQYDTTFGCDYTFIDKSQIKLDCLGGFFGYFMYEVAISQDTLVMTDTATGEVTRYRRLD